MKTLEFWCENVNKQQSLVRKRYKFWCENVIFVVSKFGVKTLTFGVKTRAERQAASLLQSESFIKIIKISQECLP